MKIDQLIIGNTSSFDDYEANVKERSISAPKKKVIKATVPFSNEVYDFSAIDGEVYWEERVLQYVFEITADSPEELEEKKREFISWVMNVMEEEIHDPFISDYHFKGTFSDISIDDSEIEKSTIAVTFTAYPYMISNIKHVSSYNIESSSQTVAKINNDSSHRVVPTFRCNVPFSVRHNGVDYQFSGGVTKHYEFKLNKGINTVIFQATNAGGKLQVEFNEEVF